MTQILTGVVHVRHPETADVVTLNVGDELPEWAVELVTNPAVLGEYSVPDAVTEPPADPDAPDANDPDPLKTGETPPAPSTRDELVARAKQLKIQVDDETTEAELELLIAAKE